MGIHVALFTLLSLMSDSSIMSDFNLVIPYIFSLWFKLPRLDIFRELQLILDTDMVGNSSACIFSSHRCRATLRKADGAKRVYNKVKTKRALPHPRSSILDFGPRARLGLI